MPKQNPRPPGPRAAPRRILARGATWRTIVRGKQVAIFADLDDALAYARERAPEGAWEVRHAKQGSNTITFRGEHNEHTPKIDLFVSAQEEAATHG